MAKTSHQSGAAQSGAATSRRSFLRTGLAVGAGTLGAGLLANGSPAVARASSSITTGDVDILRFLAAIEIIESDLWEQYNELGGIQDSEVPGGSGNRFYTAALQVLDGDMPQYIHDNTDDEFSHMTFLNAYLSQVLGAATVDLSPFATLRGSVATGVNPNKIGKRLTNLLQLNVDTSWWERYRSTENPDLGATFDPAVPTLSQPNGQFPAIPRDDTDTKGSKVKKPTTHLQAIANTAGFHFGFIEQGGTSLYPTLALQVTNAEVLRILLSIGPSETMHFQTWHDKAGNAPALTTTINGFTLTFPDLAGSTDPLLQANLIMPEPCDFISERLPKCAIIRPTLDQFGGAVATVNAFTADGLFIGQSSAFFTTLMNLAKAADAAQRGF
jgi:Ferritin-like domain